METPQAWAPRGPQGGPRHTQLAEANAPSRHARVGGRNESADPRARGGHLAPSWRSVTCGRWGFEREERTDVKEPSDDDDDGDDDEDLWDETK